eukprot:TRINITY_DN1282_c0_g1_i11.p5 TRINITY_DN1282_c0_g1~~TRINITY_DN1282_c0_g1_i11.p5  ORF type:complete len:100 (+),score=5.94 TRINITY_DN1282_c0_g1_i11:537-836(+)
MPLNFAPNVHNQYNSVLLPLSHNCIIITIMNYYNKNVDPKLKCNTQIRADPERDGRCANFQAFKFKKLFGFHISGFEDKYFQLKAGENKKSAIFIVKCV